MVREYGPSLEIPAIFLGQSQQGIVQKLQPLAASKVMLFVVGAAGDHVGPCLGESVQRAVRPIAHDDAGVARFGLRPRSCRFGLSVGGCPSADRRTYRFRSLFVNQKPPKKDDDLKIQKRQLFGLRSRSYRFLARPLTKTAEKG